MKQTALLAILPAWILSASPVRAEEAPPMLDNTHDRVQTSLKPGLKRIGTIKPRSAKEVGRSNIAIGCEMLPRDYGNFEDRKSDV